MGDLEELVEIKELTNKDPQMYQVYQQFVYKNGTLTSVNLWGKDHEIKIAECACDQIKPKIEEFISKNRMLYQPLFDLWVSRVPWGFTLRTDVKDEEQKTEFSNLYLFMNMRLSIDVQPFNYETGVMLWPPF